MSSDRSDVLTDNAIQQAVDRAGVGGTASWTDGAYGRIVLRLDGGIGRATEVTLYPEVYGLRGPEYLAETIERALSRNEVSS